MPSSQSLLVPHRIAAALPRLALLRQVLCREMVGLPAGQSVVRAAWHPAAIWPARVNRAYRFGPPEELIAVDGTFPFHWIYVADRVLTAAWEAGLCVNDVTRPGTFQFARGAEQALIATLHFARPLQLLDLSGDLSSKLGLYDALRSPDHIFCQWLGWQLDCIIAGQGGAVDGFRYPSRRHPGNIAYAISSRAMPSLVGAVFTATEPFSDGAAYAELAADPCRVMPT